MITDKELKEISIGLERMAEAVVNMKEGNLYTPIHIRDYLLYCVSVLNGTVDRDNEKKVKLHINEG